PTNEIIIKLIIVFNHLTIFLIRKIVLTLYIFFSENDCGMKFAGIILPMTSNFYPNIHILLKIIIPEIMGQMFENFHFRENKTFKSLIVYFFTLANISTESLLNLYYFLLQ
ncbi:hypothetical protein L9F63_013710, partial [Diploptera punctata]